MPHAHHPRRDRAHRATSTAATVVAAVLVLAVTLPIVALLAGAALRIFRSVAGA